MITVPLRDATRWVVYDEDELKDSRAAERDNV